LASAVLVKQSQLREIPELRDWQVQAWDFYDRVGELRFAVQWIANAISRCRLYVGLADDDGANPDPIGHDSAEDADIRAKIPLDELFGGMHAEMLSRLAMHLTVPGESYVIGFDQEGVGRRWMIASSEEFSRAGSRGVRVRLPESDRQISVNLDNSTVIRLWRQHPRRAWEADSPVRAALGVLKELVDLSSHIAATVESRLAGAGLLLLPESATLPSPLNQQGEPLHEDPAMATLIDAMVTPISDRDSSAAVVPVIVRIPEQAVGKAQWITFSTPFDERVQELRTASISRFASIVDIPAEVLTGYATANRWNAWKISEDAVRIHIEPLVNLICDALTTQYLWPALETLGVENPEKYLIWYDASDLILRPNRGPESQNLYGDFLIRGSTVRRANGFGDEDKPDEDEIRRLLLTQLATKGVDPVLVGPYLSALGIEIELPAQVVSDEWDPRLDPDAIGADGEATPPGTRIMGRPVLPTRLPTRPEPMPANPDNVDRSEVVAAASFGGEPALAAAELGALHALSRAGKRAMRNNLDREGRGRLMRMDPWSLHTQVPVTDTDIEAALSGAYDELRHVLPHHPCLQSVIDGYVRERLTTRTPHSQERLAEMLSEAGCGSPGGGSRDVA
jgi:hypothetical protein